MTEQTFIDSTTSQYNSALKKWVDWGGLLPCDTNMFLSFISDKGSLLREDRLKASSFKVYKAALKRWHVDNRYDDPTIDKRIDRALSLLASLERQNGIYKDASRYMTAEECLKLVTLLIVMTDNAKARRERLVAAISLMAGHRTSMIAQIKIDHIMNLGVSGSNIIINTPSFKTDAEAPTIIPFTGGQFCPATWIREYTADLNIEEGWLFPSPVNSGKHIARHTINEITKRVLKMAGVSGGKLTLTSFRKTMATLAAMQNVNSMAIAAQGSWSSIETINKNYVSKALALLGQAPLGVIESIKIAEKALSIEGKQTHLLEQDKEKHQHRYAELRRGYWDLVLHTNLTIEEKRGYASYFRAADKYVVEAGGESILTLFNDTCTECGLEKLVRN